MPEFVIFLRPRREGTRPGQAVVRAHCERLQLLAREGRCLVAGPFEDPAGGGMIVGTWTDLDEARAFAVEDPFVACGWEDVEVRPWSWSRPENGQLGMVEPAPGAAPGFLDTLRLRWTCRDFDPDRPLLRGHVEELLEVATRGPSEFNLQPVRPVVCHELTDRQRLRPCCWNQAQVEECGVAVVCAVDPELFLSEVPRTVSDFVARGRYPEEARAKREEFIRGYYAEEQAVRDSAVRCGVIFGHQLMLAALSCGLAGCWLVGFEPETVRAELGIPERVVLTGIVALGWPRGVKEPMPRRSLDQVAHWGGWDSGS